ncbi:MAG: hypothetical protein HYV39_02650 [Candidatus Levybacteria bacterium]|nr:hypothetical protein [Candidatus Levybacteria bacterium]
MWSKIKRPTVIVLFLVVGFLVVWGINDYINRTCCAPPPEIDKTKLSPLPKTKEACLKQGGKWGRIGISEFEKCNLKTSDKGKACTDSSQCESSCIGESFSSRSGKCSSWRITVGCYYFVNNGKVDGLLCAD